MTTATTMGVSFFRTTTEVLLLPAQITSGMAWEEDSHFGLIFLPPILCWISPPTSFKRFVSWSEPGEKWGARDNSGSFIFPFVPFLFGGLLQ